MEVDLKHHYTFEFRAWYSGGGRFEQVRSVTVAQNRGEKRNLTEAFVCDVSVVERI